MKGKVGLRVAFLLTILAIAGGYAVVRFWRPSLVKSGIVWFLIAWIASGCRWTSSKKTFQESPKTRPVVAYCT
jgi:hypothetical protein